MANIWMHNGFLQVEGEKMSKSLGNFITIRQLLTEWRDYGWPGEALRLNMLRTHYRQPLDWTFEGLDEAHKILWDWYGELEGFQTDDCISTDALKWLCDDLNTPGLISELHRLRKKKDFQTLKNTLNVLGFSGKRESIPRIASTHGSIMGVSAVTGVGELRVTEAPDQMEASGSVSPSSANVEELIEQRKVARKAKDFKESDRIRDELAKMGVVLKDNKDGTTTWEVAR
jgi:cysteinyl-tRNA synthetase